MSLFNTEALPHDTALLLRAHPLVARALPASDVRWYGAERDLGRDDVEPAPAAVRPMIMKLLQNDVVLVVDRATVPKKPGDVANIYRTRPGVDEWVSENVAEPTTGPCGHPGVRNLGGGRYTCRLDRCDATFGREAAKAVLGGGSA